MHVSRVVFVGLVVAVSLTAGCLGGEGSDLQVTEFDGGWTEGGTLEIRVTVSNLGGAEGTGTLVVDAEIDDADSYTDRREVTLAPDQSEAFVVVFEPPDEAVGSSYDVTARIE